MTASHMSCSRRPTVVVLLLAAVVAATATPQVAVAAPHSHNAAAHSLGENAATVATTGNPTKEIFGFASASTLGSTTVGYPSWNFNLLSTVAFFSLHVQYNGSLGTDGGWSVWNSSVLTGLVNTAHAHGTKVVVAIVGPSNLADQCDALYNADATTLQVVQEVQAKNVDGVNIDYEGQLGQCNPTNPAFTAQTNQSLLTGLARQLRAGLDAARPGYYLSIDTYSGSAAGSDGYFNIPDLNRYVDSFFVMTYDMDWSNQYYAPLSCSSGSLGLKCLSPVSPLGAYNYNDTLSMQQYAAVVGASKTILGQPYYGRTACVSSPVAHATPISHLSAATYLDSVAVPGSTDVKPGTFVAHRGDAFDTAGADRWDTWYDYSLGCWREMYWSDATQLGTRYDLVNQLGLRGVGFWTLNYGAGSPELWASLQGHFVTCTGATVAPDATSPQPIGGIINLKATATNCPNPVFQFWIKSPGSTAWRIVQPYSSSSTFAWDTASLPTGSYQLAVWARDVRGAGVIASSLGRLDALATFSFSLTGVTAAPCTGLTAVPAPAAPQLAGTQVSITATATGCTNARYQFWTLAPGTTAWRLVQPYSTSATFNWNTYAWAPGLYHVSVWARDGSSYGMGRNSLGSWDAYTGLTYILTTQACSGLTASPAPAAPQLSATTVTISAAASGCPGPLYQFWLLAPGSTTWVIAQAYSTASSFAWNTSGLRAGTYTVGVWTRDTSSLGASRNALGSWDRLASFPYKLTTQPCSTVTATSSPPDTSAFGTTVTITAAATGCPGPQFEFWLLSPNTKIWQKVQAYSSASTFIWTTTGKSAGVYYLSVWARDASSVGLAGNELGTWDAYTTVTYTLT